MERWEVRLPRWLPACDSGSLSPSPKSLILSVYVHNACVGQRELSCSSSGEDKSQLLKDIISRGATVTGSTFGTTGGGYTFHSHILESTRTNCYSMNVLGRCDGFLCALTVDLEVPVQQKIISFYYNFLSANHDEGQLHIEQVPPGPPTGSWTLGQMSHIQEDSIFFFFFASWQAAISVSLVHIQHWR